MESKKSSTLSTGLMFGTSAFGMGMLSMPAIFNQLGYVTALMIMLFFAAALYGSLFCLNLADDNQETKEFHDYSYFASHISRKLKALVSVAFVFSNFAVIYLFLRRATGLTVCLFNMYFDYKGWAFIMFRMLFLVVYALLSTLLFLQEDLSMLKPMAYVSLFAAFYYSILMIVMGITSPIAFKDLKAFNWYKGMPALLNIIFAAHCQFSVLGFKNILANKNRDSGNKMALIGTVVIFSIYISVGFFGYKYLGNGVGSEYILGLFLENTQTNLLFTNNTIINATLYKVMICLLVALFVSIFFTNIPLTALAFIPEIQELFFMAGYKAKRTPVAMVVGLLMFVLAIPQKLPEDLVLEFSSCFFSNFLSFGFPGIYGMFNSKNTKIKNIGFSLLLLSIFVMGADLINIVLTYL